MELSIVGDDYRPDENLSFFTTENAKKAPA